MRLTRTIGASACVWLALAVSCSSGDHRGSGGGAGGGSGGGAVGGGGGGGGAGGTGGGSAGGAGTCVTCDPTRANNSCGLSGCECAGGAQCPVGISCAEGGSTGGASGGPIGSVCVDNHPWHPVTSATTPRQRYAAAMTFDAKRNRTVLFGGIDNGTFLNDTWEYDGTDWTLVASAGPSPGAYAAMFFDPVRQRVDLYGDPGDGGMVGWSWDGTTWTPLGSTPLGGRVLTAIWDTARSRAVALISSDCGAQTWERSGMTWTKNPDAGAIPKNGALAYDPSTQRSVYFGADPLPPRSEGVGGGAGGGVDAGCALELGTWEYDGQVWSHVTTAGSPTLPILYGHRMIYLPTSSSIALIGGASSTFAPFPQYLWRYSDHAWTKYAGPYWQPRYLHGIAWDSARQKVVFFGGTNGNNALDDTWEY